MNRYSQIAGMFAVTLAAISPFAASSAIAQVIDCSVSNSSAINAAIAAAPFGPVSVQVDGACNGNVSVARDDVTLQGVATGGGIKGRITVTGKRVVIEDLEIKGNGSGDGIRVTDGASARLNSVEVIGHDNGIHVRLSSTAWIESSEVKDNAAYQLLVTENSSVRLSNSEIKAAGTTEAVGVFRLGMLRLRGGNQIENTVRDAILVFHGSQFRQDGGFDVITGARYAISAGALSEAELRNFETHGDIVGIDKSLVRLRSGTHNGNITLQRDSAATFSNSSASPVILNGNLICDDEESSHFLFGVVISGSNTCSGY